MIGAHRRNARHLAIDRDARQFQIGERAGEILVRIIAGKQQQAVHSPPAHRRYERGFAVFLVPGRGEHQHVAGALEFLLRAVDHLAVERVGEVGDHAADRLARARTQRLRRRMRLEAQTVHRPHDPGVQFRAGMRLAVEDAADTADRGAGLGGDVADGRSCRPGSAQRHCKGSLERHGFTRSWREANVFWKRYTSPGSANIHIEETLETNYGNVSKKCGRDFVACPITGRPNGRATGKRTGTWHGVSKEKSLL